MTPREALADLLARAQLSDEQRGIALRAGQLATEVAARKLRGEAVEDLERELAATVSNLASAQQHVLVRWTQDTMMALSSTVIRAVGGVA